MPSVTVRGAELEYEDRGQGPAIVFLHGTLMDRTMFAPQIEALSDRYRVIAYNHRGRSSVGGQAPFTLDDLGEDLMGLLTALGIGRAVLAGMSMGGFTVLRFALKYPQVASGLVLIDTAPVYPVEQRPEIEGMLAAIQEHGMAPLADPVAGLLFGATTARERSELVEAWKQRWLALDTAGIRNEVGSWLHAADVTDRLHEITVPSLVVHGDEDAGLSPALARTMADALPNGRFVEIKGAGHSSNLEQPAAVNTEIRLLLERVYGPVAV